MAKNPFTIHPHSVGETYAEHFIIAASVSRQLIVAGFAALTHALMPFLFPQTASKKIHALSDCLERNDRDALRHNAVINPR